MPHKNLVILPPLAFARIGTSGTPVDWFVWGPNDAAPDGSAKTTAVKCVEVDSEEGTFRPAAGGIVFKDPEGIRPVCPYFELFQLVDGKPQPVTDPELAKDLRWDIELANRKAFYRTRQEGDCVIGRISINHEQGGGKLAILGSSPLVGEPLVSMEDPIAMGHAEALPPADRLGYRVRIYPPTGLVYGPTDIASRAPGLKNVISCLNPRAAWCSWRGDERAYVQTLTAMDHGASLGLIDDVSDGVISCYLGDVRVARARISVTPPHFAPDRRYLISVADGLKDREERNLNGDDKIDELVLDIFERALEHVELTNLDALIDRFNARENQTYAFATGRPWIPQNVKIYNKPELGQDSFDEFPLTESARRKHSQFVSIDLLKRFVRQRPGFFEQILRPPGTDNPFFDGRMPALQRGSDRRPLHLTRRQYELILKWAESVQQES